MAQSETHCLVCGRALVLARTGRPKRYCSPRCRKSAERSRPRQLALDVTPSIDLAAVRHRYRVDGADTLTTSDLRALLDHPIGDGWCLGDRVSIAVALRYRTPRQA